MRWVYPLAVGAAVGILLMIPAAVILSVIGADDWLVRAAAWTVWAIAAVLTVRFLRGEG